MWGKCWHGTNGGCENGQKNHRMTVFKFAKKNKGSNVEK
jgi:hypothetical protein